MDITLEDLLRVDTRWLTSKGQERRKMLYCGRSRLLSEATRTGRVSASNEQVHAGIRSHLVAHDGICVRCVKDKAGSVFYATTMQSLQSRRMHVVSKSPAF
jgi:hypothetical protein